MLAEGSLAGRVALVTGGGTGLGKTTALELARLGAAVAVPGDVREPGQVEAAFDAAEAALGPVTTSSTTPPGTSRSGPRTSLPTDGGRSSAFSTAPFCARASSAGA